MLEDFSSRPHKSATFLAERNKEFHVWREQKMLRAPPGHSGGKLPRKRKVQEGREEEEEEEEGQEKNMENG